MPAPGPPAALPDPSQLAQRVRALAQEFGFQRCGIAGIELGEDEQHLRDWLSQGLYGSMGWMAQHGDKRSRPQELIPGTLRVISVGLDYGRNDSDDAWDTLQDGTRAYVARLVARLRDHHGHRVAHEARLVRRERHARRRDDRRAVLALVHARERHLPQALGRDVRARVDGNDTRRRARRRDIDARDARVGVRRAQERDVRRALRTHVVGEAALAGEQARVFQPAQGPADPLAGGEHGVVHGGWRKAVDAILRAWRAS